MNELMHADVFFFVTTIAVMLVTAGILVLFWYAFLIMRDLREISRTGREVAGKIGDDFESFREEMKRKGRAASSAIGFLFRFVTGLVSHPKTRRKRKTDEDDML